MSNKILDGINVSRVGVELIKHYEDCQDVREDGLVYPYLDGGGVATIGYGNTYYTGGRKVMMKDDPITKYQAEGLLIDIIEQKRDGVIALLDVTLNQNEFDALVSFAYNVGLEALKESTLLRYINKGKSTKLIMAQFKRWVYDNGKKLDGLIKRRNSEALLYGYDKLDFYE